VLLDERGDVRGGREDAGRRVDWASAGCLALEAWMMIRGCGVRVEKDGGMVGHSRRRAHHG
jgi:hypothetical protein